MQPFKEKYVVDESGNRTQVILNVQDYYQILELLEELEDIKAFDEVMKEPGESIPFAQAVQEIEQKRK